MKSGEASLKNQLGHDLFPNNVLNRFKIMLCVFKTFEIFLTF